MHAQICLTVSIGVLLATGCNETKTKPGTGGYSAAPGTAGATDRAPAKPVSGSASDVGENYDATNTGRNARDRDRSDRTADNQSESSDDLQITAQIRRAITKDSSLSVNAHNVKIITENGAVVLRGPVDSEEEKSAVVAEARRIAGDTDVVDELEVKTPVSESE